MPLGWLNYTTHCEPRASRAKRWQTSVQRFITRSFVHDNKMALWLSVVCSLSLFVLKSSVASIKSINTTPDYTQRRSKRTMTVDLGVVLALERGVLGAQSWLSDYFQTVSKSNFWMSFIRNPSLIPSNSSQYWRKRNIGKCSFVKDGCISCS